jgi:hypothetical protein
MMKHTLRFNEFPINESKLIDRYFLVQTLVATFGYSKSYSEEVVDSEISYLDSLPDEIFLYRIIFADSKKEIKQGKLGAHYSDDKESLINNHSFATGYGDIKFLVTVSVKRKEIDIQNTIHNRILYPNENEITIKNNGKAVKVQNIEKLNED